jgi:Nop14-like family
MAMDVRARPSDRTKTPEEIAQEERERLEKLEVWGITISFANNFCIPY